MTFAPRLSSLSPKQKHSGAMLLPKHIMFRRGIGGTPKNIPIASQGNGESENPFLILTNVGIHFRFLLRNNLACHEPYHVCRLPVDFESPSLEIRLDLNFMPVRTVSFSVAFHSCKLLIRPEKVSRISTPDNHQTIKRCSHVL